MYVYNQLLRYEQDVTQGQFKRSTIGLNSDYSWFENFPSPILVFLLMIKNLVNPTIYHIHPTPPLGQDMTQGQFFKRSLKGLNSEFFFT